MPFLHENLQFNKFSDNFKESRMLKLKEKKLLCLYEVHVYIVPISESWWRE